MANLLPDKEKHSVVGLYRRRLVAVGLLLLAAIIFAAAALLVPSLVLSHSSEALLASKRDTLAGRETATLEHSLGQAVADINTRLSVFADPAPASPLIKSFIDPVLAADAGALRITDFMYAAPEKKGDSSSIRISGTAPSREELLSFADRLRAVPGITSVDVPIESFIKNSDVTFTVSASLAPH